MEQLTQAQVVFVVVIAVVAAIISHLLTALFFYSAVLESESEHQRLHQKLKDIKAICESELPASESITIIDKLLEN